MKKFEIPDQFRSGLIGEIKLRRRVGDPRKQDFSPTTLDFGNIAIVLPRHFGFCYGVENAIERSYKAIQENPGKKIFLLSQMIHNPAVNDDLTSNGIQFILDTEGAQLTPWEEVQSGDIVIIPAFGTTVEIENFLLEKGVEIHKYNTTCPFVEKVWKRSTEIGLTGHTIIIHGKYKHEETRATFSRSYQNAPSIVIRDMNEAQQLAQFISGERPVTEFFNLFRDKYSEGFNPEKDLQKIGVVNQTTMLATETQEIADFFKRQMQTQYGDNYKEHFADTRDTLCYATNDNQQSTLSVLDSESDLALVVGGYNSSNTSQIASILSEKMKAYFIKDANELVSKELIRHFDYPTHQLLETAGWIPSQSKLKIVITSGASCPDSILESVIHRLLSFFTPEKSIEEVFAGLSSK